MKLITTWRALPALVVALVAIFAVASGSALAASHSHHGPTASAAHHKKHKPKKKKPAKPAQPKGPFVAKDAGSTPINPGPDTTTVETLTVPAGANYVVTAKAELGNNGSQANSVNCQLLQAFNPLDSSTEALGPQATFQRTITLTSTSTGGALKFVCTGDKGAQARNRVITAVRV